MARLNAIAGGWELTVIEKVTSGFPVFVFDSNNTSGANLVNTNAAKLHPPQSDLQSRAEQSDLVEWFNPACFSQPAAGELGNANRTPLSGPGFVNTDFSVIKHFVATGRNAGRFPGGVLQSVQPSAVRRAGRQRRGRGLRISCTFAVVNYTVNNPRLIQFGLKLALLNFSEMVYIGP